METVSYCQSCAMPLGSEDLLGTNADGSKNGDYCLYCYQNGTFTSDMTMDEMIEFCIPHLVSGTPGMTEDSARTMMKGFFPNLKRWKKD